MQKTIQEVMKTTQERPREQRPEYEQWLVSLRQGVHALSTEEQEEERWRARRGTS